jgi:hypothetical protein
MGTTPLTPESRHGSGPALAALVAAVAAAVAAAGVLGATLPTALPGGTTPGGDVPSVVEGAPRGR